MTATLMKEPDDTKSVPAKRRKAGLSDRAKQERNLGWKLAAPAFIVMMVVVAYPILNAVYLSFFNYRLTDPNGRAFIWFKNYKVILSDSTWWHAVEISTLIMLITVAIEFVLGMALAMIMNKIVIPRKTLRTIVLIPYSIITVVSAYGFQYAFAPTSGYLSVWLHNITFGAFNRNYDFFGHHWSALIAIMVSEIWKTTPFMSLLLLAGLAQVPGELQEAAEVDGATFWERLRRVTLPSMKAAIMVAVLFRALDAFRIYDNIAIMTKGSQNTGSVAILAAQQTLTRSEVGLGSAISILLFFLVIIISTIFIKLFKTDLSRVAGSDMSAEVSYRAKVGMLIAAVPIILYTLLPIGWILSLSLKTGSTVNDRSFIPNHWTWDSYKYIFTGGAHDLFVPALVNSIGICLIATFISVILAAFCAYGIARLDFPGKKLVLNAALLTAFFPSISIVTPLFNLWREIGLYNTWPGLIIPYLSLTLPLSIWTMTAFFRQIPWEMEQAAQVDGATSWQAFRKVVFPLAAPGVFTTAIIAFFNAWNDFVFSSGLSSTPGKAGHFDGAQTVPAVLGTFQGPSQFIPPTGFVAAAAVVVTIPVVILVLIFQKRIVAGLTAGAVKG